MSVQARVLIVARDDEIAGPLAEGLDRLGWRTVTARGPYAALTALSDLQIEAAIIDTSCAGEDPALLAERIRKAASPRVTPIVAIGEPNGEMRKAFDLVLQPPLHPAQMAMRLETLVRMAVAEEEFELRIQTFAERGRALEVPTRDNGPYRILAVGEPAPRFLALSNALSRLDADITGAFTAYTAFDYLHDQPFDAVLLWGGEDQREALSIAAGVGQHAPVPHSDHALSGRGFVHRRLRSLPQGRHRRRLARSRGDRYRRPDHRDRPMLPAPRPTFARRSKRPAPAA